MSTTTTPTPTPVPTAPVSIAIQGGTINEVLTLLSDALGVLAAFPPTAVPASLASVLLGIIAAAVNRIQTQTGKPIDLTQIPTEGPLP
jgi:hypothetical protein